MIAYLLCILSSLPNAASALESRISALEGNISALESQSGRLEPWLGRFTLLVAIGVALEIFVVIHDHKKEATESRICELIPEGPSLRKLGVEIASIILVLTGVMGEFGVGLWISSISIQLRSKGAELRIKNDQLLEYERSERLRLEAKVSWRSLSTAQQWVITNHLKNFAGLKVGVSYLGGNPEAAKFADDIRTALYAAKWKISPLGAYSLFGGFGGGVQPLRPSTGVRISAVGRRGRNAAEAFQRELCSTGFDTTLEGKPVAVDMSVPKPKLDVEVLVVFRPATDQGVRPLAVDTKTMSCTASK